MNKKPTWVLSVLGATILAVGLPAFANAEGRGARFDFETLDANQDGFVTEAEITAARDARFATVDTNNDGALSAAEFLASIKARVAESGRDIDEERLASRVERMFDRMDDNGDGSVTQDEMPNDHMSKRFARIDADDDGRISAEEAEAMKSKRGGKKKDRKNKDRDNG